jgi:hypothetical protein
VVSHYLGTVELPQLGIHIEADHVDIMCKCILDLSLSGAGASYDRALYPKHDNPSTSIDYAVSYFNRGSSG